MCKSPEMERVLNELAQRMFGRKRHSGQCITCGSKKVNSQDFKDERSRKEYKISCMCQKCQDEVFTEPSVFEE